MSKLRYSLILLLFICIQCEEPVALKLKETETTYLVVDGFITTEAKEHVITISNSTPFRNNEITPFIKESVASIQIVDDQDNITPLLFQGTGVYHTPANFAAREGTAYRLRFTRENGESYESVPQIVPAAGSIDDLYFNYQTRQVYNSEADQFVDMGGLQFKADYTFPESGKYMAFDWEGTFIFESEFRTCYVSEETNGIESLASNVRFETQSFQEQDLFFFNHDFRFRHKYSLNLLLYTMDRSAYNFLADVQGQLNSSGSIFDPAPRQLNSNVFNTRNEDEVVLGYFGAFNVTSKRIFITPGQIPAAAPFDVCTRSEGPGSPPAYCFNCLLYIGASDVRPSYWE
ncbi:MAG: DUF4249 domain-containing protein [Bacteroidota bacterium]